MSEQNWVAVTKVSGELQAELIRGLLQAQEIPVWLSQEGAGRAYGFTVGLLGEVEIMVPGNKIQEAKSVLERYKAGEFEDAEDRDL